jgi:type I restriction enzyme S subunit
MARITPCLENGKTAFVDILDKKEIAYGSTEFIVLRNIQNESINKYVYYFTISPKFRNTAIKSMTGTSGRQRVQTDILKNLVFFIPKIEEQGKIVSILSSLDDKIELNNQINKNLEEMAQAIFKHWFIEFEFPDGNGEPYKSSGGEMVDSKLGPIPRKWKIIKIKDEIDMKYGKNLPTNKLKKQGYPVFGANGVMGYYYKYLYYNPQIIITCRGNGSGNIFKTLPKSFITNNSIVLRIKNKDSVISKDYLKLYLINNNPYRFKTGSAQPQITIKNFNYFELLIPGKSVINQFQLIINAFEKIKYKNQKENNYLAKILDALLPKLMSGEIRVPINDKEGDE